MAEDSIKRLYVEKFDEWNRLLNKKRFSDRKLNVKVVNEGIVLPARKVELGYAGGVCDKDFNFVAGYTRKDPAKGTGGAWIHVDSSYKVPREKLVKLDEDVIFGGTLNGHFGHFMMESWCRLWFVIENPNLKLKILFVPSTQGGYKSWFDSFFRLMGIEDDRIIYVKEPTQCRSVIVPDQSQYWESFTKEWTIPFEAIKSRVTPGKPRKLYLTRAKIEASDSSTENVCNEEYFEDFFAARGFEVISIEDFSIKEQISIIMGADEIASTIGTLTHWAMFCKPEAKFIMLTRTHFDGSPFQRVINNIFGNYYIVDTSKSFMYSDHTHSVCMIGSTRCWKEFVADYFDEYIDEDDDRLYLESAVNRYVNLWCQKYADVKSKNFDRILESFKVMCNRISMLEREISRNRPLLVYQTHVSKEGWGDWKIEEQISNSLEQKLDVQAIKVRFTRPFHDLYYSVCYDEKDDWSEEVSTSQMAGTVGKSKSITGIRIWLDETASRKFNIFYRVHRFDNAWTPWAKNGEILRSNGDKINAIQIKLEP